jgi:hypothetical protein
VAPRSPFKQVEISFFALLLPKGLAALQPLQALYVHSRAIPHGAPKQRRLIVTLCHFGTDVCDKIAGIDTRVDEVQSAPYLVELAITQRPKRAVRAAIVRR